MPLEFLKNLSEEQILALINYVNKKRDPEYFREATDAQILKEPDRFDSDGNQEFYVNAWNGAFHIGSYFIQDFQMREVIGNGFNSLDAELREYLYSIYDEAYLIALKDYYDSLGVKGCNRIRRALEVNR
ncbi:MAG: hypothetical protein OSJ63_01025 [Bacilli bacterium]|nr:hypothetical protein [Bacilli bacterium]